MRRIPLLAAFLAVALPAQAITYGILDEGRHPQTAALVGRFTSGTFPYCTGTLISPTVVLTAAHCDLGNPRVFVSFEGAITEDSKLLAGTFHGHPGYDQVQSDPHDIAVIVLDQPVRGIAPAKLPAAGALDRFAVGAPFTAVGYGSGEVVNQPGGPVNPYIDVREYATSTLNAANPAWLRLSQNAATGDGGTCYGDSGGPNFIGSGAGETTVIAGTTITGDALCKSTNVIYRLDTASARAFLGRFVALP
jgi:secreted trypsin-like serine protease